MMLTENIRMWYQRNMHFFLRVAAYTSPEVLWTARTVLHFLCHLFNLPHVEIM